MHDIFVYKSNGYYLGFIRNGFLFSRDGICLGWVDNGYVWDTTGQFRGRLEEIQGRHYIVNDLFTLRPTSRSPKSSPNQTTTTNQPNIPPIALPVGLVDSF